MSPDDFLKLPKRKREELIQGFCDRYSELGRKAIRSFLRANKVRDEELDLDDSYRWMRRPEYVPTKEEVHHMASVAGLKWRAITLCLFQSGLRNSAFRALTYGMLKDQTDGETICPILNDYRTNLITRSLWDKYIYIDDVSLERLECWILRVRSLWLLGPHAELGEPSPWHLREGEPQSW